jgi:mannose-1-phosphate guanylyltransferase/mannose-6-phosphate isomerase
MRTPVVDDRPWGKFVKFCENEKATVKIIEIRCGEQLSVKTHEHRDEMWVALDQGLVALVGEDVIFMKDIVIAEDPVWIPRGTPHSIKNVNAGFDARLMEISFGDFDEGDAKRIQDRYGRT